MKKILVCYLSLNGHTEQLANFIAEGVRIAGFEITVKKITEIKKPQDLAGYDGYIFGSPTYHRDIPAKVKQFLFIAANAGLKGKAAGSFGSYTHSGDAPGIIYDTMQYVLKMEVVNLKSLNVLEDQVGTPDFIKACQDYAKAVCAMVK